MDKKFSLPRWLFLTSFIVAAVTCFAYGLWQFITFIVLISDPTSYVAGYPVFLMLEFAIYVGLGITSLLLLIRCKNKDEGGMLAKLYYSIFLIATGGWHFVSPIVFNMNNFGPLNCLVGLTNLVLGIICCCTLGMKTSKVLLIIAGSFDALWAFTLATWNLAKERAIIGLLFLLLTAAAIFFIVASSMAKEKAGASIVEQANTPNQPEPSPLTEADYEALTKLKELLDMGILTQEEFGQKKHELLSKHQ